MIFCKGEEKASLMCLQSFLLPIPAILLKLDQPRNEPCAQAGVSDTLISSGLISCHVLGEWAAILQQEKQDVNQTDAFYMKDMDKFGAEIGKGKDQVGVSFQSLIMLDHREVFKNPNAQVASHTIYIRLSEGSSQALTFFKNAR